MKRCYNRRPKTTRKMIKMRGFQYKGFKIEIFKNSYCSHFYEYEWKMYPLTPSLLKVVGMDKVINDPTSWRSAKSARWIAKKEAGYYTQLKLNENNCWIEDPRLKKQFLVK